MINKKIPELYRIIAVEIAILVILASLGCASKRLYKRPHTNISGPPEPVPGVSSVFEKCPKIPCSCSCDDPFDPRVMPKQGDFANLCLNTCEQRSVLRLSHEQVAEHVYFEVDQNDSDVVYAANVNHYNSDEELQFYIARVPLNSLKEIILQIEHAGGVQAHAQMRFSFEKENPVVLVPQRTELARNEIKVFDLTFSAEALAPPGIPYKGDYGFKSEYFQSYRLTSMDVRAKKMIIEDHHRVWQYRIGLQAHERKNVFLGFLDLGTLGKHENKYHTISNNCIIEIFRVLDERVHVPWLRRVIAKLAGRTLFMPTYAPKHLRRRGLKRKGRFRLSNLEEELGWKEHINEELYKDD